MLAFSPGMPSGYNVALTSLSLVAAIVLTGVGFAVAVAPNLPASASIGGAIVGGGIAAMHYTGMAAFEVQGHILWDPVLVSASPSGPSQDVLGVGRGLRQDEGP